MLLLVDYRGLGPWWPRQACFGGAETMERQELETRVDDSFDIYSVKGRRRWGIKEEVGFESCWFFFFFFFFL